MTTPRAQRALSQASAFPASTVFWRSLADWWLAAKHTSVAVVGDDPHPKLEHIWHSINIYQHISTYINIIIINIYQHIIYMQYICYNIIYIYIIIHPCDRMWTLLWCRVPPGTQRLTLDDRSAAHRVSNKDLHDPNFNVVDSGLSWRNFWEQSSSGNNAMYQSSTCETRSLLFLSTKTYKTLSSACRTSWS